MMPDKNVRVAAIVLALSFLLLSACGGGSDVQTGSAQGPNQGGLTGSAGSTPGSVSLTWNPPTHNMDGTPLSNLGGFRVYWGTKHGEYPHSVTIDNPGLASYVVEQLAPANWHFVVTAITTNGMESPHSNVFSKTIR
jgi:hypothetical protein